MSTLPDRAIRTPRFDGNSGAFVDGLLAWIEAIGSHQYDEAVTQCEHALQCAHLAEKNGGSASLIAASLLHDVGHLLMHSRRRRGEGTQTDLHHEEVGAKWLQRFFEPDVVEAVRLHVPAKRYLCAVEPSYWDGLSSASKHSLALQGGPMNDPERDAFASRPNCPDAVSLRRYDDGAKVCGAEVPPLAHYRSVLLESLLAT